MPNSPITGPCTDPHFADPGQTSPPTGLGACAGTRRPRLNVSVQLPSATGHSDENSGQDRSGIYVEFVRLQGKSGPAKGTKGANYLHILATSRWPRSENSYASGKRSRAGSPTVPCSTMQNCPLRFSH